MPLGETFMQKLIAGIMGQDCMRFLPMCIESLKGADILVYIDGGSKDDSIEFASKHGAEIIVNTYDQEDKKMNGKQRNVFLNYLKEKYYGDWCIFCDADEVVEDLSKIKDFIQTAEEGLYSVHMRHFIGDLGHEDSTVPKHWVPNRLFKIDENLIYPEVEHPVLQVKAPPLEEGKIGFISDHIFSHTDCTCIWHLAYVPNLWEIKKRYDNHMKKSEMHSPEFLKNWYYAHLFGQYPKTQINLTDIPEIILEKFGIDKDEFYFQNRGVEVKHFVMVRQWQDYFHIPAVLDLGCGRGPYLYAWSVVSSGTHIQGIELSSWAVKNAFVPCIKQGDISDEEVMNIEHQDMNLYSNTWPLITAIDVLEHLDDEQLTKTLDNMAKHGKRFLFSIPFKGDPNLENDKTHKQFRTKDEWKQLIQSHGINVKDAPTDWYYHQQLLIGEKI